MQDILAPEKFSLNDLEGLGAQVFGLFEKYDPAEAMNALTAGQYAREDGLNYGGRGPAWSNVTVRKVIAKYAAQAKKVVLLDWHTGLGDFGKPYFISFNDVGSAEYLVSETWWGKGVFGDQSAFEKSGSQPNYKGVLVAGIEQELPPQADVVRAVVEFGTYDNATMMGALIVDRWLRFAASQPFDQGTLQIQQWMIERFIPDDEAWRSSVRAAAGTIHKQMLCGLADW